MNKDTAVHIAASVGNFEVVKELVKFQARFDTTNSNDQTPSDVARSQGYDEIADYLDKRTAYQPEYQQHRHAQHGKQATSHHANDNYSTISSDQNESDFIREALSNLSLVEKCALLQYNPNTVGLDSEQVHSALGLMNESEKQAIDQEVSQSSPICLIYANTFYSF